MLAETLAGPEAVSLVAMFQLPAVLYFNVMSVLVMSIYSDSEEKPSPVDVLIKMVKNPIIQGILAGTVCLVIRMNLPAGRNGEPIFTLRNDLPWIMTAFTHLSRMCSPAYRRHPSVHARDHGGLPDQLQQKQKSGKVNRKSVAGSFLLTQ